VRETSKKIFIMESGLKGWCATVMLKGLDANYILIMEDLGLKWWDESGCEIEDIFSFFRSAGFECFRVRIWVGDVGPSKLLYASEIIERACGSGFSIQPTFFLSDCWADLYKQPEPRSWVSRSLQDKLGLVRIYMSNVMDKLSSFEDKCVYYQIGNEIDYGLCGIFAGDKKKRKNLKWLKEKVWSREGEILKECIRVIRDKARSDKPIAFHLGKWWDQLLLDSFLSAMNEFGVEYELLCISFYPTVLGVGFTPLREIKKMAERYGKILSIAEYAYPSDRMRGQFWFMSKPASGYPLTLEGQASWIRDFLAECRSLGIYGAFYWSPELYLTRDYRGRVSEPRDMPLTFGWGPMSFFNERGQVKPCINSLKSDKS
ncbi:MAG: arabinogalactan endo-1,4-beta-galactosidase, partial [Candidatus Bathyarchaeota archaeon]|nr:arabinogalactan endo-1,4-beta-galactosidase [Candidatus Bathyarchaeota archaeon]